MANRGAFVNNFDAGTLESGQPLLRVVARRLDDLHPTLDDRPYISGVVRWVDGGEEGEVHAERFVGHLPATVYLAREILRGALRQARNDPQGARIGNCCR